MNKLILTISTLALLGSSAFALSVNQIVNQSKASIVAIIESNSKTGETFEATGWFITGKRIVTNSHVVENGRNVDLIQIVNVVTGQQYTMDHIAYNNNMTDVAIITIAGNNTTYLNLSTLEPKVGMSVVVIGNPKEEYGRVLTGTLGQTQYYGLNKRQNYTLVNAAIEGGSSGSPVLDPNGDVIGMIWGANEDGKSEGAAVNLKTFVWLNWTLLTST